MKVKRKRRMSRRRRERTYIAVMVLLAIAVSIGLTRSVMRDDKEFEEYEQQSQEFNARMQRIDEKREASGQNAMLEQVRTWQQETQKEFLADMAAAGHFVATCYSAEEAVKVIEEYCKLMNHKMGDCEIVIPLENREELRNITMSIPNNSILKNGEIKESKPRKK